MNANIYASDLSLARHRFRKYHFCRGNSNRRKTRLGIILRGSGSYIYLSKRLKVTAGDVVFIPENIYCYSEWHGAPEIEVVYLSCFLHYDSFGYEPQIINCDDGTKESILHIADLLDRDPPEMLEAYAQFYLLLKKLLRSRCAAVLFQNISVLYSYLHQFQTVL